MGLLTPRRLSSQEPVDVDIKTCLVSCLNSTLVFGCQTPYAIQSRLKRSMVEPTRLRVQSPRSFQDTPRPYPTLRLL